MKFPYEIRPSRIHGEGLFALRNFRVGEYIPDMWKLHPGWEWNFKGFNRSCDPNILLHPEADTDYLVIKEIKEGDELTVSYEQSPCNCPVCR
jgi:SET domain-containing protein